MLPRVSAALAQFIAPISTPSASKKEASQTGVGFERFASPHQTHQRGKDKEQDSTQHQPESEQKQPEASILPLRPRAEAPPGTGDPSVPIKDLPPGISTALLQLMHVLKQQRVAILRWVGVGIYQSANRLQKKSGRVRKGTIMDEKAG